MKAGGGDATDLFVTCLDYSLGQANKDLLPGLRRCKWHTHEDTEECDPEPEDPRRPSAADLPYPYP
jgi:hypothetical protein